MTVNQVSLFLENKPGHLNAICRILSDAAINIITLSMADTEQFGILRLIINEWDDAKTVLEGAGFAVTVTPVIAVEVEDRPGGMVAILDILAKDEINIEYMHVLTFRRRNSNVLIFRFDNPTKAVNALLVAGKTMLNHEDLFVGMNAGA